MYGSSVAGGHDTVSGDSEEGAHKQREQEENFRLPSLRTLKRKEIVRTVNHYQLFIFPARWAVR